jgi:putative ABC transport system permease protein
MSTLTQIAAVSALNVRSIPQRLGTSSVIVVGIAGVVAVLISVLAMSTGLVRAMQKSGPDPRAIVVRTGASAEMASAITNSAAVTIADAAGVKHGLDGRPLASPETLVIVNLNKKDGDETAAPLRGIAPVGFAVHQELKIVSGRSFKPGLTELIVGKSAARLYQGLDIGSKIKFAGTLWTVVGIFDAGGSQHDGELIADQPTLNSAFQRGDSSQSVTVMLESPQAFQTFKDAITTNPQLQVDVSTERDFGTQQSSVISTILSVVAYVVGGIMAVGAVFGALNTMYSAVSTRSREIATLRALGFGAGPVVVSVFVEALLLAVIGGTLGALLAWLLFNGHSVDTRLGFSGQLIFDLAVTPALVVLGITWAFVIGVIGGLFPAIRAARLPVAMALQAV